MPPCGGAPYSNASSSAPNFARASSREWPISANERSSSARSWMRTEPPPSSQPLSTTSYCCASAPPAGSPAERLLTSPEVVASSSTCSGTGALNGLCVASQRLDSASHWYIGKRCTQQKARISGSAMFASSAISTRRRPSTSAESTRSPATARMRSPSGAVLLPPLALQIASTDSGERNFAIGDLISPSGCRAIQTSPLAPWRFARSVRSSISERATPPFPGTRMARMRPPLARTSSNTLKPVAAGSAAPRSISSIP